MHPLIPAGGMQGYNHNVREKENQSERKRQKKEPEERPERNTAVFPNRVLLKQGNGKWDQSKNKQDLLYFENKTETES